MIHREEELSLGSVSQSQKREEHAPSGADYSASLAAERNFGSTVPAKTVSSLTDKSYLRALGE